MRIFFKIFHISVGPRYIFERCPIAEFAKEHGYLDIMPAFCNSDYPAMEMIHGHLIRKYTCAISDKCDYWIVGDESEAAKKHPKKTDHNYQTNTTTSDLQTCFRRILRFFRQILQHI